MRVCLGVTLCFALEIGGALASDVNRGNHVDALMRDATPLFEDREVCARVTEVGDKVVAASKNRSSFTFRFYVLNTSDVTAFSAPGGHVYVTTGLLRTLKSEDELAAVLGHEVAHVNEHHLTRAEMSVKTRKFWNIVMFVGMQAAMIYVGGLVDNALGDSLATGSTTYLTADGHQFTVVENRLGEMISGLAQNAAAMGTSVGGETLLRLYYHGYKDEYEFKADDLAIQYAGQAGYNSAALVDVLDRLGGSPGTVVTAGLSHLHSSGKVLTARTAALKARTAPSQEH